MITLWHNPRCSKSRQALALLQEAGAQVTVRRYLEDRPEAAEIAAAQKALGLPLAEMVRHKEPEFRAAGLTRDSDETALLAAMAAHPKLIERPIAFAEGRAVLGRPPERVLTLL